MKNKTTTSATNSRLVGLTISTRPSQLTLTEIIGLTSSRL